MKVVSPEKKLVDKSVAECTEIIYEAKIAEITSTENVCVCSYTICVILAVMALATSIGIGAYFAYFFYSLWCLKKDVTRIKLGTRTQWNCAQTTI